MHDHFKMASNVGGNDSVLVSLDIFEGDFEDIIEVLKVDEYINEFSNDLCEDIELGNFPCEVCDKVCKSKGGLKLHCIKKHTKNELEAKKEEEQKEELVDEEFITKLLRKTLENVVTSDNVFSEIISKEFQAYEEYGFGRAMSHKKYYINCYTCYKFYTSIDKQ
ncbi:uncharacterized protein LOC130614112 isoform X2 [Hydractinia symbiolongicarpus]|uniref:uncharacterized protein LOC130614112 isoform X2 n=1 Tax=Hydractinia symbiolongicarpus TaxID=13093 RepID=UPI00254AD938|nr:uncharacterized protein LOC130614112 isoform X2 [Hydractinia symbiolongicarpus]